MNKTCCLQQSDHPKLSIKLSFSNRQEAASQFLSVKACHPPSESAHQKSASALTSPSHKPCASPFSFWGFFFRMDSWIIRSWIWVSSTDVNLKIGVSNVGHCLCFRFVGSFFVGIPLTELTEQPRWGNNTRLCKSISFTYSTLALLRFYMRWSQKSGFGCFSIKRYSQNIHSVLSLCLILMLENRC